MSSGVKPEGVRSAVAGFGDGVWRRVKRARLDRLSGIGVIAVVLAWVSTALIAWAIFVGTAPPPLGQLTDDSVVVSAAPAWLRVLVYSGAGALIVVGVVGAFSRAASDRRGRQIVVGAVVVAVAGVSDAIAAMGDLARDQPVVAFAGSLCAAAGIVVGVGALVQLRKHPGARRTAILTLVGAVLLGAPWWLLAVTTNGTVDDPAVDPVWVTVSMIVVNCACIAAFYGFATGSESRIQAVRSNVHRVRGQAWVIVVLLVILIVIVLRLTIARTLFDDDPGGDAALWTLRSPESWVHAVLVAGIVVWFAIRSESAPYREKGFRLVVGILTAAGSYAFVLSIALSLSFLLSIAFGVPIIDTVPLTECGPFDCIAAIRVVASLGLLVFLVLPGFRGTTAWAVAVPSVVFLLPGTLSPLIVAVWPGVPTFWATPVEVVIAIVLACGVIVIGQSFGAFRSVTANVLLRLLVYPIVVLHAAVLVPAALGADVGASVAMLLVLASVVFLLPPVAASRHRQSSAVALASTAALFAAMALITPATSEGWTRTAQLTAFLLLSIPCTVALVLRSSRNEFAGAPPPVSPRATPESEAIRSSEG